MLSICAEVFKFMVVIEYISRALGVNYDLDQENTSSLFQEWKAPQLCLESVMPTKENKGATKNLDINAK